MSDSARGEVVFQTIGDSIPKVGGAMWQPKDDAPAEEPSGLGSIRWEGYSHAGMWDMLMRAEPDGMFSQSRSWQQLSNDVRQLNTEVQQQLQSVFGTWRGAAATSMANTGSSLLNWANNASDTTGTIGAHLESYTNALVRARHEMPQPTPDSAQNWVRNDVGDDTTEGPEGSYMLHRAHSDQRVSAAAAHEAKQKAIHVMRSFESQSADIKRSVGTYQTAPTVGPISGPVDGPGPGGPGPNPPGPTGPTRPIPYPPTNPPSKPLPPGPPGYPDPGQPDPGGPRYHGDTGLGTTSSSSFDPIGATGSAGGYGGLGAGGFGAGGDSTLGGRLGGALGAGGAAGAAGAGVGGSVGAGGVPGPGGVLGESAAAARGGAGAGGATGMFPPGAGTRGDKDGQHKRSRYVIGEDLFDDDEPLPPSVLDANQVERGGY